MFMPNHKSKSAHETTTVLVVEDDRLFREMLCEIVQLLQPTWTVYEAVNGQQGVEMAIARRPDLIIMDFNMPLMNGYQMAMALQQKSETRAIPLILSTCEDYSHPLVARLRSICMAVLFKPFSLRELGHILEKIQPAQLHLSASQHFMPEAARLELA